jgi:hypothetical protein
MLKPFQKYFYETSKVYEFKVKIANFELTSEVMESIKNAIDAYQIESISKPRRLPIQEHTVFGNLGPCECEVIDIAVRYPTIAEQIRQLIISRARVNADHVYVYTQDQYLNEEDLDAKIVSQGADGPIISNPELQDEPGAQELVGDKRISSFMKELNDAKHRLNTVYEVAGGETPAAKTTNEIPQATVTPVNKQKTSRTKGR